MINRIKAIQVKTLAVVCAALLLAGSLASPVLAAGLSLIHAEEEQMDMADGTRSHPYALGKTLSFSAKQLYTSKPDLPKFDITLTLKSLKTPEEIKSIEERTKRSLYGDSLTVVEFEMQFDGAQEDPMYLFNILQVYAVNSSMSQGIATMQDMDLNWVDNLYTGTTYRGYFIQDDLKDVKYLTVTYQPFDGGDAKTVWFDVTLPVTEANAPADAGEDFSDFVTVGNWKSADGKQSLNLKEGGSADYVNGETKMSLSWKEDKTKGIITITYAPLNMKSELQMKKGEAGNSLVAGSSEFTPAKGADTPKKEETMTAAKLNRLLAEQPVAVINTNYIVQDANYKAIYPDLLSATILNQSGVDIKNATIAFAAWDANNYPIKLKSRITESYVMQCVFSDVNLVNGGTYGENSGMQLSALMTASVATFKAVVVSYDDFNGNTWKNPYYQDWLNLYMNKPLKASEPEEDSEGTIYTDAETVRRVQEALNNAGFDCGTPDGDAGPKTHGAIQSYQEAKGLTVSGEIDDALLRSLGLK